MSGAGPLIEILIDRDGPVTRAAVVSDGRLTDLHIDHADHPSLLGRMFLGRVERIVTAMDAAFVDLGEGLSGFLAAADVRRADGKPKQGNDRIGTLLRTGQPVLVQVKADPVGAKGPSLTMDVTLPGRFLIHAPFGRDIAVSKRLGAGPARAELTKRIQSLVTGSGWIVRAGAAQAGDDRLAAESEALHLAWRGIRDAAASTPVPSLLYSGADATARLLTELGGTVPARILVDGPDLAKPLSAWCADRTPDLLPLIEQHRDSRHKDPRRLFDLRDLDGAIAELLGTRVALPRGGSLVIEPTEALTVVDVNAGERGNPLEVNLEAAAEIARQLRLRNVGGIVVVDFVNMRARSDAERVLNALTEAVESDPVQTQVYGMSKLGLVEVTRARRGSPLSALLRVAHRP